MIDMKKILGLFLFFMGISPFCKGENDVLLILNDLGSDHLTTNTPNNIRFTGFSDFRNALEYFDNSYQNKLYFHLIVKLPQNCQTFPDDQPNWGASYVPLGNQNFVTPQTGDNVEVHYNNEFILDLGQLLTLEDNFITSSLPKVFFPVCNNFNNFVNFPFKLAISYGGGDNPPPIPRNKIFELDPVNYPNLNLNEDFEIDISKPFLNITNPANQKTPDFTFNLQEATWQIFSVSNSQPFSSTSNTIVFKNLHCGEQHLFANLDATFTCPSGQSFSFHYENFPFNFQIAANTPIIEPSTLPYDKSIVVTNPEKGVAYKWLFEEGGSNKYLFSGTRISCSKSGNYKLVQYPLLEGCGYYVSPPITIDDSKTRTTNLLSIKILNSTIKNVSEVSNAGNALGKDYIENIQYLDELSRPIYSAAIKAGKGSEDISQHFEYDEWGRQKKSFLPYAKLQTTPGSFDPNAAANQLSFYQTNGDVAHDNQPFSEVEFDNSKNLSKVLNRLGPGAVWKENEKFSKEDAYLYNPSNAPFYQYPVYRLYWAYPVGWQEKAMTDNTDPSHQTYWANELMVKEYVSEDGQVTYEFMNLLGQTIATRTMPRTPGAPSIKPLTTYYVYDDFGRLRMKIPPKVSALFGLTSSIIYNGNAFLQLATDVPSGPLVNALCTQYEYDHKGRLIVEQKPGGVKVATVYDILNRPVMSQDESQRLNNPGLGNANRWSFIKYDKIGRVVLTGEIDFGFNSTVRRTDLQTQADASNTWFEKRADNPEMQGYTDQAFPALGGQTYTLLTVQYYDDYGFKLGNAYNQNFTVDVTFVDWPTLELGGAPTLCKDLQSLATGKKVRVLGTENEGEWLSEIYVYDEKERLIATLADNAFGCDGMADEDKGYRKINDTYGYLEKKVDKHQNSLAHPIFPDQMVEITTYNYNERHQLLSKTHQINGEDPQELVSYSYDVFGNVKRKSLGGNLQDIDYKRDIRGRLTHINDPDHVGDNTQASPGSGAAQPDIFGMKILRENVATAGPAHSANTSIGNQAAQNRFDGSITGLQWKSLKDKTHRSYTYFYDDFNRLDKAIFRAKTETSTWTYGPDRSEYHFSEGQYDENGNIQGYRQTGPVDQVSMGSTAETDKLEYTYQTLNGIKTNLLTGVSDAGYAASYPLDPYSANFRRDFRANSQYAYDGAGRLVSDNGKNISKISYNLLDLPEEIEFGSGGDTRIFTVYAADGRKLKYVYEKNGNAPRPDQITTWYAGGYQYRIHNITVESVVPKDILFAHVETGRIAYVWDPGADQAPRLWQYQYHIYDHQGNLRVAFQESYTKSKYEAGMELVNAQIEETEFQFVETTRELNTAQSRTGSYASKLNPLGGKPLGPMKWVKVEKGDTVSMEAFAHYSEPQLASTNNSWQQGLAGFLLGSLANSLYSPTLENGQPNAAYQQLVLLGSTLASLGLNNLNQTDPNLPRAYLKYIQYDKDSQFVSQGIVPITDEANESYQQLFLQIVASQDGFVQFFVANETLQDVYFDDISGVVRRPRIIQEGHYYPFGLLMAGISDLGNPEYAYFYTGKELLEDEALQYYDYGARMYDVQIGRWTSHDPVYQYASPYSFCGSDPINYIDEDGRIAFLIPIIIGAAIGAYAGGSIANNSANPFKWEWDKASTYRDMFYGAVVGAGTAWGGAAIAAGIGKAAVAGAGTYGAMAGGGAAGFTGSLGFAMIQNHGVLDWSDLRRAGYAGLTGIVAGGLGAYIGGYEGAFTGGFTGGAMNTWINGGSFEQGLLAGAIGGGVAVGAYSISMGKAYRDYKKAGGTWNRYQHRKISIGVQRSHARGREWGAWITEDGIESWGFGDKGGVDPNRDPTPSDIGEIHTHPNGKGVLEYHSYNDGIRIERPSTVIGWKNSYYQNKAINPYKSSNPELLWELNFGKPGFPVSTLPYNTLSHFYGFPFFNFYFGGLQL